MKRILLILLVVVSATGCIPARNGGVWWAISPNRSSVTVSDIPNYPDYVTGSWNNMAGWELFKSVPANTGPFVTFHPNTPTIVNGIAVPAAAYLDRDANGWGIHCFIFYDPTYRGVEAGVSAHELGHCLGFPDFLSCDDPYRGIMAACTFWTDRRGWWVGDDVTMMAQAGYR